MRLGIVGFALLCLGANLPELKTFDGRHSIATVEVTMAYLVPKDREPLKDWRDRLDYYAKRIERFHLREFDAQSKLIVNVVPKPVQSEMSCVELRGKNPNQTFDNSTNETAKLLGWPKEPKGYPILLVLSEINWRELDDFTRTREVDGKQIFEGHVAGDGRHFPGAESGGSRATTSGSKGRGLVSADGWRVPYSGSDCVIYHEGVGHPIGFPHPEPIDDSVMGTAQYKNWIGQSYLNREQKIKLGWVPAKIPSDLKDDLFSRFTAIQDPIVPKEGQDVALKLRWSEGAKVKSMRVRYQTELRGEWQESLFDINEAAPSKWPIGKFEKATPVSYRVDVKLEDGQTTELWGYFQVKKK